MQIETQKQLKPFNTLSLNAIASHYVQIHSPESVSSSKACKSMTDS